MSNSKRDAITHNLGEETPGSLMQAKRQAVRHTRQAQGALERGNLTGAIEYLESAKDNANYCSDLEAACENFGVNCSSQ